MPEPLRPEEIAELQNMLTSLLHSINSGEITASIGTRYRLSGAVAALGAALGDLDDVLDRLDEGSA